MSGRDQGRRMGAWLNALACLGALAVFVGAIVGFSGRREGGETASALEAPAPVAPGAAFAGLAGNRSQPPFTAAAAAAASAAADPKSVAAPASGLSHSPQVGAETFAETFEEHPLRALMSESDVLDESIESAGSDATGKADAADDEHGVRRVSLIRNGEMKYPYIRVEETVRTDPAAGVPRLAGIQAMVGDHVVVRLREGVEEAALVAAVNRSGYHLRKKLQSPGLYLVAVPQPNVDSVPEALATLGEELAVVARAEPDYLYTLCNTPDDPDYQYLWGLHNTGQFEGVTPDADIDAPEAWDVTTGDASVLVGLIDSGVDHKHPDLKANIWTNPKEIPGDGLDNDGNGYIDDVHGWDFVNQDSDPFDDLSHGTHCAGTIGAVGNNGKGVVGVCWRVSIAAMKIFDGGGNPAAMSDIVDAVRYATSIGVRLTSNSWGGGPRSTELEQAIAEAGAGGVLFVTSAGNHKGNNDLYPTYPASYECNNIIAVAASTGNDTLASFSCFGMESVDLAAPGVSVWSTLPGNKYGKKSGTSMAGPHVAGVAALLFAQQPMFSGEQVRDAILAGVDPIASMEGRIATGGRLNARGALNRVAFSVTWIKPVNDGSTDGADGNGDTIVNPGERIGLRAQAYAGALAGVKNARGTVTVVEGAECVSVVDGDIVFGDIPADGRSMGDGAYLLDVSQDCPTPFAVALQHTLTGDDMDPRIDTWRLTVYQTRAISGVVRLDGAPVEGIQVRAVCLGAHKHDMSVKSDTQGRYSLVAVDGTNEVYAVQQGWLSSDRHIVVGPGEPVVLDFDFETATISGRVVDRNAGFGPLPGAEVVYVGDVNGSVVSGADGSFSITHVYGRAAKVTLSASKSDYSPTEPFSVMVPPSVSDIVLDMGYAGLVVTPHAVAATARRGEAATVSLAIGNEGSDTLTWKMWTVDDGLKPALAENGWYDDSMMLDFIPYESDHLMPYGIAFDGTYLYVTDVAEYTHDLYVYDPKTGTRIDGFSIDGVDLLACLEWDGEYLWGVDTWKHRVVKIDLTQRKLVHSMPLPNPYGILEEEVHGLAVGPDAIWLMGVYNCLLYKIDKTTGAEFRAPVVVSEELEWTRDLQYRDGELWAAPLGNTFKRIDPETGDILEDIVHAGYIAAEFGFCDDGAGHMWRLSRYMRSIILIDPGRENNGWLRATPGSGTVARWASTDATIMLDGATLEPGTHQGDIFLSSNDPNDPRLVVPVVFTVTGASGNRPPVADAGPDVTVRDSDQDGYASVALDGSASRDPDGSVLTYEWSDHDGNVLGTAAEIQVDLPISVHPLALEVRDASGAIHQDSMVVNVEGGTPNALPVADAGSPQTIVDGGADGIESVTLDGSASYDPDGFIVSYTWYDASKEVIATGPQPTVNFLIGEHVLTLEVEDERFAVASDTVTVTVQVNPADPDINLPALLNVTAARDEVKTVVIDIANAGGGTLTWRLLPDIVDISKKRHMFRHPAGLMYGLTDDGSGGLWSADAYDLTAPHDKLTLYRMSSDGRVLDYRLIDRLQEPPDGLDGAGPGGTAWDFQNNTLFYMQGHWACRLNMSTWKGKEIAADGLMMFVTQGFAVDEQHIHFSLFSAIARSDKHTGERLPGSYNLHNVLGLGLEDRLMMPGLADVRGFKAISGFQANKKNFAFLAVLKPDYETGNHEVISFTRFGKKHTQYFDYMSWDHEWGMWVSPLHRTGKKSEVYKLDDCARFWMRTGPQFGETRSGNSSSVTLTFDARECEPGSTYNGTLCVLSNDPDEEHVGFPITFTVTDGSGDNNPPTADAGADRTVTDADNSGSETVTLDGSGSTDADGSIVSYVWTEGGTQLTTGVSPTVDLAVGTHTIVLTVTDDDGATDSATVVVTVNAGGSGSDELVMHLALDESGGTAASNSSGAGNDGTLKNGAAFVPAGGQDGGAVVCDGVDDRIEVADSADINLRTVDLRTITLWFRADDVSGGKQVLYKEGGGSKGLALYLDGGNLYVGAWPNCSYVQTAAPGDGQWHHASLVLDAGAGTLRGYLDGVEYGAGTAVAVGSHSGDISLGGNDGSFVAHDGTISGGAAFAGRLDEARVYNRALSAAEIAALVGAVNEPPIAEAGADRTVTDTDNSGSESVTLDGSGSSDVDGTIVSYVWTESGTEIATGVSPTVDLAVGTHTITLTVTDDDGATDTDTVVVTVEEYVNRPPTAMAGADPVSGDTATEFYFYGTGSSDPDGTIVSYEWTEGGDVLSTAAEFLHTFGAAGAYTVTLTVTDDDGAADSDTVVVTVGEPGEFKGECGSVSVAQSGPDQWHTVSLAQSYTDPVVVMGPALNADPDPVTIRVRNVTGSSFEFQLDEWDYQDGVHAEETVGYMVVERGTHLLPGGGRLQAGHIDAGSSATALTFPQPFADTPVVLSQVVTVNDAQAAAIRQKSITASGLSLYLQSQELGGKSHGVETVAWIAVDNGLDAAVAGLESGITPDKVTQDWYPIAFASSFADTPVLLATMQRADGGDTAGTRAQSLTASGVEVKVEEEQSSGDEVKHTTESVGYLAVNPGVWGGGGPATVVGVEASDAMASEPLGEYGSGRFRIVREGDLSADLTVDYELDGTAENGVDYSTLKGTARIRASRTSQNVSVSPRADAEVEPDETVVLKLAGTADYGVDPEASEATVTLTDNTSFETPVIAITAADATAAEPTLKRNYGRFRISRDSRLDEELTVALNLAGTAEDGTDYKTLPTSVTFKAGQSARTLTVRPYADAAEEGDETVVMSIAAGAGYEVSATENSATVTILDTTDLSTPTVSVTAPDATAVEPQLGKNLGKYRIERTSRFHETLTVVCTLTGTAANATDYRAISLPIVLNPDVGRRDITLVPLDDDLVEGDETAMLTIQADPAYTIGAATATVTIQDGD